MPHVEEGIMLLLSKFLPQIKMHFLDLYYVNVNSRRNSCVSVDIPTGATQICYDGLCSFRLYGPYMMISRVNN